MTRIVAISEFRLSAEYEYRADNWAGQLGLAHYGKQNRLAENETATAGYTLLEAGLNYYFDWQQQEIMAFAKVQNLTNRLDF